MNLGFTITTLMEFIVAYWNQPVGYGRVDGGRSTQVSRDGLRRALLIQGVHDAEREDEVAAAQNGRAHRPGDEADADAVERHEFAHRLEARRGAGDDGQRECAGEIFLDSAGRGLFARYGQAAAWRG